jgi:integrase
LSAAAHHALKRKRITADKMPSIETPREAQKKTAWLTKSELRRTIDECREPKLKAFIQIAYYTAGRRRSVETLRKEQVDLRQGRIRRPTRRCSNANQKSAGRLCRCSPRSVQWSSS